MAALATRDTNITDNAANSSAGRQYSHAFPPNLVEFVEKSIVTGNLAKLSLVSLVLL
jgi:hypothetical protein